MQAMRDVYKRPANCPSIGVPVVEKSILESMSGAAQDRDKAMKFMQGWVMTALSAMGSIADDIKPYELDDNCPWVRPIYAKMIDVIRILAHLSQNEIAKHRKTEAKSFLPKPYKRIAAPKVDSPGLKLFGPELAEDLKSCDEEAKMSNKLKKNVDFYRGRHQPYQRGRGRSRYNEPRQQVQYQNQGQSSNPVQLPFQQPAQCPVQPTQGFQQTLPLQQFQPVNYQPQYQPRFFRGRGRGGKRRGNRQ